ncbi:MAG: 2-C-methyl-D-erythritol 2,4-cyclodiphosphate synthase [Chlorobi bacterium]|nr:2-C-methyl-D-erythritol 2,4-cyclodiphosphate synthase [Chlorobiota bacterium]
MLSDYKIGFGYDVHKFAENRKLILGGVEIPFDKGLEGHSDADALLHAICDALLGALALGDIGKHFPDTDIRYQNADSKIFLRESYKLVKEKGYRLGNIDSTVILEKPKLLPHIDKMRERIAKVLNVPVDLVSVKATTSEKMGFVGSGEGIKAVATVLISKDNS